MKRTIIIFVFILPLILSAQTVVRWYTSMGNFTAELREDLVPITVNNFLTLTEENFYDGLHFHRVVEGFVIQDGDPTGTGYGGSDTTIPLEISPFLHHDTAGTIGMARSTDPNSASSQYYITLDAASWLDGNYAVFGYVFDGLDVVNNIGLVEVDGNDTPINPVYIDSVRIVSPRVLLFDPSERDFALEQNSEQFFMIICNNNTVSYNWYYDEELLPEENDLLSYTFIESGLHTIKCRISGDYEYDYIKTWNITVNGTDYTPANISETMIYLNNYPNPFNPETVIEFRIPHLNPSIQSAIVDIFDTKGRKIKTFNESIVNDQTFTKLIWTGKDDNGKSVNSGIYFYRLKYGTYSKTKKCILLK